MSCAGLLLSGMHAGGPGLPAIAIDDPAGGAIFPPDMAAPAFVWRDRSAASAWRIDLRFGDGSPGLSVATRGEALSVGEIDKRCAPLNGELPRLTPEQAAARSWRPSLAIWAAIKSHSAGRTTVLTLIGLQGRIEVSRGQVSFEISRDAVGAPIFYRDVPLRMAGEAQNGRKPAQPPRGVMQPLPQSALPLVAWRIRNVGEPRSRLLLEGLPVCANCHSFSADGKTLAMDLDGPANDKGLYSIAPLQPRTSIRSQNVIEWSSFRETAAAGSRVGFLSRISPDGQYVITTVKRMDFVSNYADYRFLQVAYPTRGVLAYYRRKTGEMHLLPGADDPRYVHVDAVWSPDGKYLVFARAEAKEAYAEGQTMPEFAGDPNETRIRYDLYRIPFNGGKGGQAEPIAGASQNGMSNSFPKISPDGRWIVFVQCRNGQFLRPDSRLYIVPAGGGQARAMRCNTPLMNSWHSFSPNGRWMVFSSKGRSPYTQLFLTHLDQQGNDSPAIPIENSTAANRAANLPEFVNIPPGGLLRIDVPAADVYGLTGRGMELMRSGQFEAAIAEYEKALKLAPNDPQVHNNLAFALAQQGDLAGAAAHFRKVLEMNPRSVAAHNNLGNVLQAMGKPREALEEWQTSLSFNPDSIPAHHNLAGTLYALGRYSDAMAHWRAALRVEAGRVASLRLLAWALATCPDPAMRNGAEAVALAEKARRLSDASDPAVLSTLAAAYAESGRFADAAATARLALTLARQQNAKYLVEALPGWIALYDSGRPVREK
jgi:tetratricopeptide (TPR) repeat protein